MSDRELGAIVLLQVQRDPLKVKGVSYDPGGILRIEEASLDSLGMLGRHEETWVVDAHHGAHPKARAGGRRPLSMGFEGHYEAMADRFGSADLGCAGENIIVDTAGRVTMADLEGQIVIHAAEGEVVLENARVAAPCAEFTSWIKGLDSVLPKLEQAEDVDFLDHGTRGFVLDVSGLDGPAVIRVGDRVSIRS